MANAAQRALVFLMLPVYTAVLSPSSYGRLGLLITLQSGAILLLQAGMETSITRHYFTLAPNRSDQDRFVQSSWRFLSVMAPALATATAGVILIAFHRSPVFRPTEAALTLASAATFVIATVVPLTLLRVEQRLRDYVTMTAVLAITTTGFTIVAVVVLKLQVVGWFAAATLSNLAAVAVALKILPVRRVDRFDGAGVRVALTLGIGLIPHGISLWALALADRVVLTGLVSPARLGVYTLAANLALPAMVVIQSMNQGFLPSYARAQHRESADASSLDQLASLQMLLIIAVSLAVAILAAPIVGVLRPAYAEAASVVPWLVLGGAVWGLYQIPMNVISMVAGRTQYVWLLGISSAVLGVGSLYVLVPKWGLDGAGAASAFGYLVLLIGTLIYLRALRERLPLQLGTFVVGLGVAVVAYFAASLLPRVGLVSLFGRSGIVIVAVFVLAGIGGVRPRHLVRLTHRGGGQ